MIKPRVIAAVLLAGALCDPALGQNPQEMERISLRVTSVSPGGTIVIDRGTRDGLKKGDLVVFRPRGGGAYRGTVVQLVDLSATVELLDRTFVPEPGTRGEAAIPKARFARPEQPVKKVEPEPEPDTQEHPPWKKRDDKWSPGMPLLAKVKPVHPERRPMRTTGRVFAIGNLTQNSQTDFSSSLFRVGTDLLIENPLGHGGGLRLDAEFDYRTEWSDSGDLDLTGRQASYYWGGTRFSPTRGELGRFLQHGMPEFGLLDGFEISQRSKNGNRYGASIGYLPELDDDLETGKDLQVAGYYYWVSDQNEQLTIGGGYQKTLHHGNSDRDLLVAKLRYLPLLGWDVHATAWVDYYYGRDDVKGTGFEVTQALASVSRRWDTGNGIDLTYRRIRFPELLRNEYTPVVQQALADNRYDSLTLTGWRWLGDDTRFHGVASGWDDEDEDGASVEAGIDVQDLFADHSRTDVTVFGTLGQFSSVLGARLSHGRSVSNGRWDAFYEIANHHLDGFGASADDMLQHRLGVSRSLRTASGWDLSVQAEVGLWDDEWSWFAGFFVQRSF